VLKQLNSLVPKENAFKLEFLLEETSERLFNAEKLNSSSLEFKISFSRLLIDLITWQFSLIRQYCSHFASLANNVQKTNNTKNIFFKIPISNMIKQTKKIKQYIKEYYFLF